MLRNFLMNYLSTLATAMQFNEGVIYPTHSIVQNINGNWESKMGSGSVLEFKNPGDLAGGVYGKPCFAFTKQRAFSQG
jgi:hypothetical protein